MINITKRQAGYALASAALGFWAFIKVNSISGPAFEPIIAACTNPELKIEEFASKTGYHEYDPRVGLGAFSILVCLITQLLFELRNTVPEGFLTWGGVIVVGLPVAAFATIGAGRAGARGPIRYPTAVGMLYQLFGVSVMFPMIWLPAFILGEGKRGAPLTMFRVFASVPLALPGIVFTAIVFLADTDSQLWTSSAGALGGPILVCFGLILFTDKSHEIVATKENVKATSDAAKKVYNLLAAVGLPFWYVMVYVTYQTYGFFIVNLWNSIWVDANSSVRFMTIDTGILYVAILMFIAYRSNEMKAVKALLLTTIVGPATACCMALREIEDETEFVVSEDDKKKD